MKTKRNLLVATLVLLMMVTAVGYAAWSDTLEVNGTVNTGEFDVRWQTVDNGDASIAFPTNYESEVTVARQDDEDVLAVTITNAKPNETYSMTISTENLGDVIALFNGVVVSDGSNESLFTSTIATETFQVGGVDAFTVSVTDIDAHQLEAADGTTYDSHDFTLTIDMENTLPEDIITQNNFYIHFHYSQL